MIYKERRKIKWENTADEKLEEIINKKYNHFYPHTKEYAKKFLKESGKLNRKLKLNLIVKEDFIEQFNIQRSDCKIQYDFSLIPDILTTNENVIIICIDKNKSGKILGEFKSSFKKLILDKIDIDHYKTRINYTSNKSNDLFLNFKKNILDIYGDELYDFSESNFINNYIEIKIKCKKCGNYFWKRPDVLLNKSGNNVSPGCPFCSYINREPINKLNTKSWIQKAIEHYGENKFDYSKVRYFNSKTPVDITCNTCHITFQQLPNVHLQQVYGCPICSKRIVGQEMRRSKEYWLGEFEKAHGKGKFDYSKAIFGLNHEKIEIIDLETGQSFWQTPYSHAIGSGNTSFMSNGEKKVCDWLIDNQTKGLSYIRNFTIYDKIEGRNSSRVIIDFQIFYEGNEIWIEYDGEQHFNPNTFSQFYNSKEEQFISYEKQYKRDRNVEKYCKENNILLIRIPYTYKTYEEIGKVLEKIIINKKNPEEIIKPVIPIDLDTFYKT